MPRLGVPLTNPLEFQQSRLTRFSTVGNFSPASVGARARVKAMAAFPRIVRCFSWSCRRGKVRGEFRIPRRVCGLCLLYAMDYVAVLSYVTSNFLKKTTLMVDDIHP